MENDKLIEILNSLKSTTYDQFDGVWSNERLAEIDEAIVLATSAILNSLRPDQISIIWCVDDIKNRAQENVGFEIAETLTDEDYLEILHEIKHEHDCNLGITWDTIDVYVDKKLKGPYKK